MQERGRTSDIQGRWRCRARRRTPSAHGCGELRIVERAGERRSEIDHRTVHAPQGDARHRVPRFRGRVGRHWWTRHAPCATSPHPHVSRGRGTAPERGRGLWLVCPIRGDLTTAPNFDGKDGVIRRVFSARPGLPVRERGGLCPVAGSVAGGLVLAHACGVADAGLQVAADGLELARAVAGQVGGPALELVDQARGLRLGLRRRERDAALQGQAAQVGLLPGSRWWAGGAARGSVVIGRGRRSRRAGPGWSSPGPSGLAAGDTQCRACTMPMAGVLG
jgi:hypothetical protein